MRGFIAGLVIGGSAVAAGFMLSDPGAPESPPAEPASEHRPEARAEPEARPEQVPLLKGGPRTPAPETADPAKPFSQGEIVLRIGEGYVFEDDHASAGVKPDSVDIYCQDIRYEASLYCAHGAQPALAPMTSVGLPKRPVDAAALVSDAPDVLAARNLALKQQTRPQATGFGFVKARNGKTYKLALLSIGGHPEAFKRVVRIQYEPVKARPGGGELQLPRIAGARPLPQTDRTAIRRALAVGRSVPGDSFARGISGEYRKLEDLMPDTKLTEKGYFYLEEPLTTKLTLGRYGAVWAAGGVAADGVVSLERGDAFGTPGDLDGTVSNNSYSYLYVGGDLVGTISVGSYATVVIEGDIRGTLRVRSYTDFYLKGRILGTLDCKGSCWSTFYFEGYWSRSDLEQLGKGFGSVTLHVRESDLEDGKHEKVGSWREVLVGHESWKKIAR